MQFHTQKIYLIIEPLKLGLLSTIRGDVSEMLELTRMNFLPPPGTGNGQDF
jgi:hypothetical protein